MTASKHESILLGPCKEDRGRDGSLGLRAGTGDTTHPRRHDRVGKRTGSIKAREPQSYLEGKVSTQPFCNAPQASDSFFPSAKSIRVNAS